jgi:predicted ATPase
MRSAQEVVLGALGSGHTLGLALALVQAGCPVALLTGDLAAADQLVTTLLDRATSHSLGFWHAEALCYAGILHVLRSDVAKGVKLFRTGVQELLDYHATMNVTGYLAAMASALADASEHAQAGAMVDQAFHLAERDGEGWCRPELLRLRGVLMPARATGEVAAAETQYRRALDLAHHQGALSWELRAATSLARLLQDQGRTEEARRMLGSVYGRFSEGFGTADLARARALLDMLAG